MHDVDVRRMELRDACGRYGSSAPAGCGREDDDGLATVATWHTRYAGRQHLLVNVAFSADDGETWRPVFLGPDQGRVVLRNAMLVPAETARVRVRVTDGFNTATAISPPFHEAGGKPVVRIISPAAGAEVPSGQMIYLKGVAYDAHHQLMPDEQMNWYAGDRKLGTGRTLSLPPFLPGQTSLRLVVLGADREPVERSATLRVVPR